MIADSYNPTSAAQYAEQASQAHDQMPDNRFGTFVLVLGGK